MGGRPARGESGSRLAGLRRGPAARGTAGSCLACLAGAACGRAANRPDHSGAAAMTAGRVRAGGREVPTAAALGSRQLSGGPLRSGMRLVRLYAASRRAPAAVAAIAACAIGLKIALIWHWDSYGALQVPLVFEAGSAAAITVTSSSMFGEVERATGQWLPFLR